MLPLIILVTLSASAFGKHCKELYKVADYLNPKTFLKESKVLRKELQLDLEDINQAKMLVYRFPVFEHLGFGKPGGPSWHTYESRHPLSLLKGMKVGWETKTQYGHARLRLDWDPVKGGHYNIEITEKKNGKLEHHKLAVNFLCGGEKCSEAQVKKIADKMQ